MSDATPRTESPFKAIADKIVGVEPKAVEAAQVSDDLPASSQPADEAVAPEGVEGTPEGEQAEQDDSTTEAQEPTHTVVVNGKSEQVPLSELIGGYQRNADYTQKSQAVASEKKAVETAKAEVSSLQRHYAERIGMLEAALKPQLPTPEAMNAALQAGDTATYLKMQNQIMQFQAIQGEKAHITQAQQAQMQTELKVRLESENQSLVSKLPEYAKPEAHTKLRTYLMNTLGFSDEEVGGITDHRAIVAADKAMKWDELQSKKPDVQKRVDSLPKLAKPGARQDKGAVKQHEYSQAIKTLQENGKFNSDAERMAVFGKFVN